ncbi:MAG: hypothetical protein JXA17_07180 [Dehalococcoidales bacterium]|nr:hypothetical protein [Dehalococcoidales bacterium]
MSELTVYATSLDGHIEKSDSSYSTAHGASNGDTVNATANYIQTYNGYWSNKYWIDRGYLYFDTSALGAGVTITAATLSLYGYTKGNANPGQSDLGIFHGSFDTPNDGLALADYGAILGCITLGADSYYDYTSFSLSAYNDKALNATGIGWINKTGITKFALRLKGDVDVSTPTGDNYVYPYSSEAGEGYKPKLVITYTTGELKTSGDSGNGVEVTSLRGLENIETGIGIEQSQTGAVIFSDDIGSGLEIGGLLKGLFGQDQGNGIDKIKLLSSKAGQDLQLHSHQGHVGIPHKEVKL